MSMVDYYFTRPSVSVARLAWKNWNPDTKDDFPTRRGESRWRSVWLHQSDQFLAPDQFGPGTASWRHLLNLFCNLTRLITSIPWISQVIQCCSTNVESGHFRVNTTNAWPNSPTCVRQRTIQLKLLLHLCLFAFLMISYNVTSSRWQCSSCNKTVQPQLPCIGNADTTPKHIHTHTLLWSLYFAHFPL